MIEYLVHIDADNPPPDLVLATAEVPETVSRVELTSDDLPAGWQQYPPLEALSEIGDNFIKDKQSAILIVPSALAPTDNNWILNPSHPDSSEIVIQPTEPFHYDPRSLQNQR